MQWLSYVRPSEWGAWCCVRSLYVAGLGPTRHSGASFARIARPLSATGASADQGKARLPGYRRSSGKKRKSAAVSQCSQPIFWLCDASLGASYAALHSAFLPCAMFEACASTPPFAFSAPGGSEILFILSLAGWIDLNFFCSFGWDGLCRKPLRLRC